MAFGSMAAGGVLERHPGLRCAFLEGTCGWLPWYLWRLDEAWETFGPGSKIQISQTPSQYFLRRCSIATDADEKPLRQVEAIGDDNIVGSTDYPHSDGRFPVAIEESSASRTSATRPSPRSSGTTARSSTSCRRAGKPAVCCLPPD